MSIATAIQNAQTKVANAYTAVSTKGGTLPATQDLANLPTAINSISWWSSTKYGISLDELLWEVDGTWILPLPTGWDSDLVISWFTWIGAFAFSYKFYRNNKLKSVVVNDLQYANNSSSFDRAFNYCSNLETASFPDLVEANGATVFSYCFNSCTKLKSASFPLLEEIKGTTGFQYIFSSCTIFESVSFPKLRVIWNADATTGTTYRQFYYAFQNCTRLTELSFPALEEIRCNGTNANTGTFGYNAYVEKIYMPKLTTISKTSAYWSTLGADNIFTNCTALTELHFWTANKTAIEATTGYATKWWAPATCTIYFDL